MKLGQSCDEKSSIAPRGSPGDGPCIDANDAGATIEELVHRRQSRASEADDADIGHEILGERGESFPRRVLPDGDVVAWFFRRHR